MTPLTLAERTLVQVAAVVRLHDDATLTLEAAQACLWAIATSAESELRSLERERSA